MAGTDTEDDTKTPPADQTPPAGSSTPPAPKEPIVASSSSTTTTKVTVGQAVHFRFTDPIFGTVLDGAGLVVAVQDDEVLVAPVEPRVISVQVGNVEPLADEE